ncbi:hypothetical protein CCP4SC76_1150008 [Gammaproteobacteria bacterium]
MSGCSNQRPDLKGIKTLSPGEF